MENATFSNFLIVLIVLFLTNFSYSQIEAPCKTAPSQDAVTVIPPQIQQNVDLNATHYFRVNAHLFPNSSAGYDVTEEDVRKSLHILNAAFNPHGIYFVRECAIFEWNFTTTDCGYLSNLFPDNAINIIFLEKTTEPRGLAADVGSTDFLIKGNYNGVLNYEGDLLAMHSTTIIHEMGHCLGLYHTHHNNPSDGFGLSCLGNSQETCVECVNGDTENRENCGDLVADTDPSRLNFGEVLPDCSYNNPGETDESGECMSFGFGTYMPQVNNYMNYAWPECRDAFTPGQVERMFCIIDMVPDLQAALIMPDEEERIIPTGTTEILQLVMPPI